MAQSESAISVATATESLLDACQHAVWFQHHCSQNTRSDGILATELDDLAMLAKASANSVRPFLPLLVEVSTLAPDEFFGFSGVCHHEVAVAILEHFLWDVYVIGDSVGPTQYWLTGENFEDHRCVSDWLSVRNHMAESSLKINKSGTLNPAPEFNRLLALVRRDSMLACQLVASRGTVTADRDGHVSKADLDAVVGQFIEFKTIQNLYSPTAPRKGTKNRAMYLYSEIRKLYLKHDEKLDHVLPETYSEFRRSLQSVQSGQ